MSVIVEGLDMPTRCADCPMCYDYLDNNYFCAMWVEEDDIADIFGNRPSYCPLREIEGEA